MILRTRGVATNPGALDTWLTNNGGYEGGCDIVCMYHPPPSSCPLCSARPRPRLDSWMLTSRLDVMCGGVR
jgi:hypothetical protein